MIITFGSIFGSGFGASSAGRAPAAPAVSPFGPDFLLSVNAAQNVRSGSAYDAGGNLIGAPESSPQARARKASLAEIQKFLRDGDTGKARLAAQDLLKKNPRDSIASAYIGRTHLLEGNYQGAEEFLNRAAAGGSNEQIEADLRAARTLKQGHAAAVDEAKKLLKREQTSREGLQLATLVLDQDEENIDARLAIADYYERTGKLNLAGAELTEAVTATPRTKIGPLVGYLERFARRHADDRGSHDLLAQAYASEGRLGEAKESFNKALDLSPDDIVFQAELKEDFAKVIARLGRDQLARGDETAARRTFKEALALRNNDEHRADYSDLEYAAGLKAVRTGRLNDAVRHLDEARAHLPSAESEANDKRKDNLIKAYDSLLTKFTAASDLRGIVSARNGAYQIDTKDTTRKRSLADAYDAYGLDLMTKPDYRLAYRQFKAAADLFTDDLNYKAHRDDARSRF